MLQPGAGDAEHFRALVHCRDAIGQRGKQFRHAAGARADVKQGAKRPLAQRRRQRGLDRLVGTVEGAQCVPFLGMAGEIGFGALLPRRADRGEVAAIFFAAGGESGVVAFRGGKKTRRRSPQGRRAIFPDRASQEHPAAFLAPFGKARIAQNPYMPRHARLALTQHLRKLSHRQFHGAEEAHDTQPCRVRQSAQEGVNSHPKAYKEFFICGQPLGFPRVSAIFLLFALVKTVSYTMSRRLAREPLCLR